MTIGCIKADDFGNKLYLKEPRREGNKIFVKYRSTYNDIPFQEVELYPADGGRNFIITGDDGTVLWIFNVGWIDKITD